MIDDDEASSSCGGGVKKNLERVLVDLGRSQILKMREIHLPLRMRLSTVLVRLIPEAKRASRPMQKYGFDEEEGFEEEIYHEHIHQQQSSHKYQPAAVQYQTKQQPQAAQRSSSSSSQ